LTRDTSTSSNTEQDGPPGTDDSPPVAADDNSPPAEENAAVPDPAATPEASNDPTQAELDATLTPQPTPTSSRTVIEEPAGEPLDLKTPIRRLQPRGYERLQ
jgi:hypothetical protein